MDKRACPCPIFLPTAKGGDHINHIGVREVPGFNFGQQVHLDEHVKRPEHEHEGRWLRLSLGLPYPKRDERNEGVTAFFCRQDVTIQRKYSEPKFLFIEKPGHLLLR